MNKVMVWHRWESRGEWTPYLLTRYEAGRVLALHPKYYSATNDGPKPRERDDRDREYKRRS